MSVTNVKPGDLIYVKDFKRSIKENGLIKFSKGHGMAILIGQQMDHVPEPDVKNLFMLMGKIGFLTFDDLAEFAGVEKTKEIVTQFEAKYYGQPVAPKEKPSLLILPANVEAFDERVKKETEN